MKHCDSCGEDFDTAAVCCPECGALFLDNGQADGPSTEETVAVMGLLGLL